MSKQMEYEWEQAWLPEGRYINFDAALDMTWTLTNLLGFGEIEVVADDSPDREVFRVEGWWDLESRTIGYPGCQNDGLIPESTVLHEVAHAWRDLVWGESDEPHDPLFVGLLMSLHRWMSPGWWYETAGTETCPIRAAADAGVLPPFVYTSLTAIGRG